MARYCRQAVVVYRNLSRPCDSSLWSRLETDVRAMRSWRERLGGAFGDLGVAERAPCGAIPATSSQQHQDVVGLDNKRRRIVAPGPPARIAGSNGGTSRRRRIGAVHVRAASVATDHRCLHDEQERVGLRIVAYRHGIDVRYVVVAKVDVASHWPRAPKVQVRRVVANPVAVAQRVVVADSCRARHERPVLAQLYDVRAVLRGYDLAHQRAEVRKMVGKDSGYGVVVCLGLRVVLGAIDERRLLLRAPVQPIRKPRAVCGRRQREAVGVVVVDVQAVRRKLHPCVQAGVRAIVDVVVVAQAGSVGIPRIL